MNLALLLLGSVALVACGDASEPIVRDVGPTAGSMVVAPPAAAANPAPAAVAGACPAGLAAVTSLATDATATDLQIVKGVATFRNGNDVIKVDPKSAVRSILYTSPQLNQAFVDAQGVVTIETDDDGNTFLNVISGDVAGATAPLTTPPVTVTPTSPWDPTSSFVFASDDSSFYVLANVIDDGDTIFKLDRSDPTNMTTLAQLGAPLTYPQLAGTDIWFVRDGQRVYTVKQTVDPTGATSTVNVGPPAEVFGIGYADCKLAVSDSHTFCSTGKAVEQRDLTGANMLTVFDSMKDPVPSILGTVTLGGSTLYVRDEPMGADALTNGIRAITSSGTAGDEKQVVCGRSAIGNIAIGDALIVWSEDGKGVFSAPR